MLCPSRQRARFELRRLPFLADQRATLVNVKLKWVKDRPLDSVVASERHLRPVLHLVHLLSYHPRGRVPSFNLLKRCRQFGLPHRHGDIVAFMRRYPTIFRESPDPGAGAPCFSLSEDAIRLREQEVEALADAETDLVDRLRRLLMLTADRSLPLPTVDQLQWDMGLPSDYHLTLIPRHPEAFSIVRLPGDERLWLRLVCWDPRLAVSELEKKSVASETETEGKGLAFPVKFTKGFGLRKKCMEWLREWQTLPYTSPYADASHLDPRTDESEKRNVGVFHELLHLTIAKKTERRNVSNLRKPLSLPQKFTKAFGRHPGIFYLSEKLATQTVVLREAYDGRKLLITHPLQEIRRKYVGLLRAARSQWTGRSSTKVDEQATLYSKAVDLADASESSSSDDERGDVYASS
ncbi:protein WHAT'S THIS FACTOR 9, mitochondrial-like [Zingiber officinale]|uniref:PORR domain-containing protein n=1 Tax=Zingiber officinale TaxID=94328 RepID=A0A8J5HCR4_ZINOF|nr:protein WHAT'S THIS FACTOR 9, mitochondrial-like [Zingiber officinale]KAG6518787.1 hypothetical protein ZIOFF_022268 [Zingiber officinale]